MKICITAELQFKIYGIQSIITKHTKTRKSAKAIQWGKEIFQQVMPEQFYNHVLRY